VTALLPLVRKLSIVTKELQVVKLEPNWAQLDYLNVVEDSLHKGKPIRIIVLKARQLGISTMTEALMFTFAFIWDHMRGMVVAHENDASEHLLGMIDLYWDTYPFRTLYTPKFSSRKEKAWVETGSSIKVATAENARAGRSRTIHYLHASEVAFWRYAKDTMLGLRQTIPTTPHSVIVLESTANGVGNWFYNQWHAAEKGDTDYIPLFYPWFKHPEYLASFINMPYSSLNELDTEEKALRGMGLSDDRLAWRRWAIKNLCDDDVEKFHQEYPTTPDEAFVTTGKNVYPIGHLRQCYQPMNGLRGRLLKEAKTSRFIHDALGPLTIYRFPSDDHDYGVYIAGADPTRTTRGDYACIQVINRRTLEQVATYRAKIDPGSFGQQVALIGRYYNTALVVPETTGPGSTTLGALQAIHYPAIFRKRMPNRTPGQDEVADSWGWDTTHRTKDLAVGWLLKLIVDHSIVLHDKATFAEMRDFVTGDSGEYGPASPDGHDDTVTALAIAVAAHNLEPPLGAYRGKNFTGEPEDPAWMGWDEQMEGT